MFNNHVQKNIPAATAKEHMDDYLAGIDSAIKNNDRAHLHVILKLVNNDEDLTTAHKLLVYQAAVKKLENAAFPVVEE